MRLVYLSLAWILGIYLGSQYGVPWSAISILLGVSVVIVILSHRRKILLWCGLCLVLLFGGILRFEVVSTGDELQGYRGIYELKGVVAADPDVKDHSTSLRLEVKMIRGFEEEWRDVSGTALVYASKYPDLDDSRDFPYYRYGELAPFLATKQGLITT